MKAIYRLADAMRRDADTMWKTQWQRFEKPFFAVDEWKKFEITVTEMNRRLDLYSEKLHRK